MASVGHAAHILAQRHPELTTDVVSRYVTHLKDTIGAARASAVYSMACRSAPVAENPMNLHRGSVVEIEGERFVVLGCGFMTLEFASLARPGALRTVNKDEFARLGAEGFKVLDEHESGRILDAAMGG